MRKGFANSPSSRWNADAFELISSSPSKLPNVKVTLIRLISSCAHPIRTKRAHLPITARTKPSSTQVRCLFRPCREILEQIGGTSTIVNLSIYLQKQLDRQWSEMFPAAPVQILFSFIDIVLGTVTPDYLCFPYPQTLTSLCGYY